MWQTIRALRDHDERLDTALRQARLLWADSGHAPARLPEQITTMMPATANEAFLRAFRTRVVTAGGGDTSAYAMQRLHRYRAEHGHALVPASYTDPSGFKLGLWVARCRTDYRLRALPPQRITALEALDGWVWNVNEARWRQALAALQGFADQHGHVTVPRTYTAPGGHRLGPWVRQVRVDMRRGHLPCCPTLKIPTNRAFTMPML
ncbi:helicase associated domain-containing protein [Streptacidiphilus sp. EB129]|uniref:helicase associated domain-containing protein n=1 Tax=Streptacidiphilus sp. EB129 TaxID=3156262 RepID=UPI003516A8BE